MSTAIAPRVRSSSSLPVRQTLGVLPSWAFWNNPEHCRLAAPFLIVPSVVALGVACCVVGSLPGGWLMAGLLAGGVSAMVPMFSAGLVERMIRRRLRERAAGYLRPARATGELREG